MPIFAVFIVLQFDYGNVDTVCLLNGIFSQFTVIYNLYFFFFNLVFLLPVEFFSILLSFFYLSFFLFFNFSFALPLLYNPIMTQC